VRVPVFAFLAFLVGHAAGATPGPGILWIRNVHSREELRIRPFGRYGVPLRLAWARLNHLFRSWRTGDRRPIHPRLLRVLAHLQHRFGGRRIELVSGYRDPGPGDPASSYHHVGHAADIEIAGIAERDIYDYCRTLEKLGCGLYPNGSHAHLDARSRRATWLDLSRYGEPAEYVRSPQQYLEQHRDAGRRRNRPEAQP
jgi:uncharacterized protein YcbK (DUF882 family)